MKLIYKVLMASIILVVLCILVVMFVDRVDESQNSKLFKTSASSNLDVNIKAGPGGHAKSDEVGINNDTIIKIE